MSSQHPITPPLELVGQWSETIYQQTEQDDERDLYIATAAARWGADQELDACCAWIGPLGIKGGDTLRRARRAKPPSLKEQALAILDDCSDRLDGAHENIIRRALEQLND